MKMRFFDLAKKMARKSDHPQHKIGGAVTRGSKVVSLGFNKCKTHPRSNHIFRATHCELDCILGLKEEELNGASIYLYRENKSGTIAMSRPCRWCYELLRNVGIKKIYYTDYGSFKEEEIS
jgi:deoxycytidylate deaminase